MLGIVNTWLIRLFCIFWVIFLFLDYFNHSGYLTQAFTYFEYSGLLITTAVLTAGVAWIFIFVRKKSPLLEIRNFRNGYHYIFVLLYMALIMGFCISKTEVTDSIGSAVVTFLVRSVIFHMAILLVMLSAFGTGIYIVEKTGIQFSDGGKILTALAVGFTGMGLVLFVLGACGILNGVICGIVLLLMWIPGWRQILNLLRLQIISKKQPFELHWAAVIPYAFVLFLIALNFCYITRPIPIGFDDMNLYMNTPKLLAGYGALTKGGDAYNWSLIMSMGFVIYKSPTVALLLSVVPGILCLLVLHRIGTIIKLSTEWLLFACTLFYTFPTVIWQSRNDAKVDLAMLFMMLCAVLMLVEFYFSVKKNNSIFKFKQIQISTETFLWMLCGLITGFAFGIKYTAFLGIFGFLVFIFYIRAGKWAAVGMFFLNFALIFGLKLTRFAAFEAHSVLLTVTPFILSLLSFGIAYMKNKAFLLPSLKTSILFCCCIGISFLPWAVKNISENKSIAFNSIITGKSALPDLYPGKHIGFSPDKTIDKKNETGVQVASVVGVEDIGKLFAQLNEAGKTNSSVMKKENTYTDKHEEIRRYLGYESGLIRFISFPYDLAMKTNVKLWSADIGILLLILLPLFMFGFSKNNLYGNILKIILLTFLLIASILSVEMHHGPFHLDSAIENLKVNAFAEMGSFKTIALPVYVFLKTFLLKAGDLLMPVYNLLTVQSMGLSFMLVMISSVLIYFLFAIRIKQFSTPVKSLVLLTISMLMFWAILASGIFWYGLTGFALLTLIIALLSQEMGTGESRGKKFFPFLISSCLAIWLILIIPFQFMPIRFTMMKDMRQVDFKSFIDNPFIKYAIGASGEKEVIKQFFQPAELQILNVLNKDKDAKILNVSTFLTYHIENNDARVYIDNQIGIFDRIYNDINSDKIETVKELKRKGIRYVLVSLYTPTMDVTPEKSLTKKFNNMMGVLLNNPGSQLLFTNRMVERPDGNMERIVEGKRVRAMYHLAGMRMLEQGSVAMFEILQ